MDQPNGRPADSKKGKDAGHGNRFQSNLLVLYSLRAINKRYDFYLGTELPYQGAKFDDLIFKYRTQGNNEDAWSYQYLQANHKMYKTELTKIKETQMLEDDGDFSVPKYFRSFLELHRRRENIENCIICTNADVDQELVEENATLEMLAFEGFEKSTRKKPACYKLKDTPELRNKLKARSISHVLAEKLCKEAMQGTIVLNAQDETFRHYHMALISEHVIDLDAKKFH